MLYGWQFADEKVSIPISKGAAINCFGLITKNNKLIYAITQESVTKNNKLIYAITQESVTTDFNI